MDVRCDRCQTEYELDESRITDAGVAVKCTNCGNVFKVRLPASSPSGPSVLPVPGAIPPPGAGQASAPVLGGGAPRVWYVRRYDGSTLTLNDLTDLQRAVVERQVAPDDGVSISGGAWHTLGSIPELASFFEVVRASGRTVSGSTVAAGPGVSQEVRRATTGSLQAQGRTLTPVWEEGPSALGSAAAPTGDPAWVARAPAADPELDALMEKEDTQFLRKGRMGPWIGVLIALALVGGAVALYALGVPGMSAPGTLPVAPIKPPDVNAQPKPQPEAQPSGAAEAPAAKPAPKPPEKTEASAPATDGKALAPAPPAKAAPEKTGDKPEPAGGPRNMTGVAAGASRKGTAVAEAAEGGVPGGRSFDYYISQGHKLLDSKPSAALALFEKAADLDPKSPEPDSGRGLAYANMEKLSDAATAFQAALRKSSEFTEAILGLADVSAQQGNRRKAIGLYQRYLNLTPDGPDAPAARAQLDELKAEAPASPAQAPAPAPAPAAAAPVEAAAPPAASANFKRVDVSPPPPPPPVVVPDTAPPAR